MTADISAVIIIIIIITIIIISAFSIIIISTDDGGYLITAAVYLFVVLFLSFSYLFLFVRLCAILRKKNILTDFDGRAWSHCLEDNSGSLSRYTGCFFFQFSG